MPRLAPAAVLISTVLLWAAPGAAAKEIAGMKICGRGDCVELKRSLGQRLHNTAGLSGLSVDAPGRVSHYRLVMLFGDGEGGVAARISYAYAPSIHAVLPLEEGSGQSWMRVSGKVAGRLNRLAEGLAPFRARRIVVDDGVEPPEVWEPWRDAAATEDGGGVPRPLIAGVPAAALLFGAGLVVLRRRRAGSGG